MGRPPIRVLLDGEVKGADDRTLFWSLNYFNPAWIARAVRRTAARAGRARRKRRKATTKED